jgi:hypothetical protein
MGCGDATEPPANQGQLSEVRSPVEVVLAVGDEVRVDSILEVAFLDVPADSRCPTTVLCPWAGDGEVVIALTMGDGPTQEFSLHTALQPRSVQLATYRVTLVDLSPYPYVPGQIPLDEYAARLRVERAQP